MSFNNKVDTVTEDFLVPKVVDTALRENTFAVDVLSKAKMFKGSTHEFPIKYQKGTSGTSFIKYDTLPTSETETRVKLTANPRFYAKNVALAVTDIAANATDNQVLDLVEVEMSSAAQDMADELGTLFYGDGTGNSSKDFHGLEAIVDDGTNVATYFGLARATYTTLNATVTASSGTLSLAKMSTLYNAITDGSVAPDTIYTTPTVFSLYESLLTPMQRLNTNVGSKAGLRGGTGYTTLDYKGMPVKKDRKATSGVLYMVNLDYINFYAAPLNKVEGMKAVKIASKDIEGNTYSSVPGLGFQWSGFAKAQNALAWNGFIILGGDLISQNPLRNGKLTGITSV